MSMGASRPAPAGERRFAPSLRAADLRPSSGAGADSSPAPATPRYEDGWDLGEAAPWIVEEPEDWRTRTAADSRRLRRACAGMMVVYAAGLLVGFVLVRLVGMIG